MSGNPTRIAPPKFDQRNEQHTRSSVETRIRSNESLLDNEVRLFKADLTLANGANANVELPSVARYLRLTGPSGAFSISGFQGGYEGKRLILYNDSGQTVTFTNNATSTAANRLLTMTGADIAVPSPGLAQFIYSVDELRWLMENPYARAGANTDITSVYLDNTGLKVKDTNASHGLTLKPNSDLSADRTLSIVTGDASLTLDVVALAALRGHLSGLALANNGSDANNDIDIAVGMAVDDGFAAYLRLTSGLTKRLDASWAVGTNQGGLDTGAKANSTWYHLWLIQRSDTGVVDALFSTSTTAPTMPANYDRKRRLGAVVTDGSGNLRAFVQQGDTFWWATPIQDVNATNPGTSATSRTLTTPLGVATEAILAVNLNIATLGTYLYVSPLALTDATPSASVFTVHNATVNQGQSQTETRVLTNTSSAIRTRVSNSDAGVGILILTRGWVDRRGRDD
jgi:hypothetical protein